MRYALNGGGASSDDADFFVGQFMQIATAIAAGIIVVPTTGVKSVALKGVDTQNSW